MLNLLDVHAFIFLFWFPDLNSWRKKNEKLFAMPLFNTLCQILNPHIMYVTVAVGRFAALVLLQCLLKRGLLGIRF